MERPQKALLGAWSAFFLDIASERDAAIVIVVVIVVIVVVIVIVIIVTVIVVYCQC